MMGDRPVLGNGPSILDLYRQGKTAHQRPDRVKVASDEPPAPVPPIPYTRNTARPPSVHTQPERKSIAARPTSVYSLRGRSKDRSKVKSKIKHGFSRSRKASPDATFEIVTVSRRNSKAVHDYNNFDLDLKALPPLPTSSSKGHRRKSTHIDLLDAVPIKDSLREEASGMRNYGEDVADRNITMYIPESARTAIDSRRHSRGRSDAGIAYTGTLQSGAADWLNQPWVKEGKKPWEEFDRSEHDSENRGATSVRSIQPDDGFDWPIQTMNSYESDTGDDREESTTDDDFELGAVTISDEMFHQQHTFETIEKSINTAHPETFYFS